MIQFGATTLDFASLDSIDIENLSNQIQSQSKDGSLVIGSVIEGGSFIRAQRSTIQITCLRVQMRAIIDLFTSTPDNVFALVFPRAISLFGEDKSTMYNVKIRSITQVGKNEVNGLSSYSLTIWGSSSAPIIPTDPYWSNVVLAMHMDGANNSTTFTDLKGHSVTPYGNAKISTTQSKFGGSSAYFDGGGDYLQIPHSSDLDLSTGDFTIECLVNCASNNTDYTSIYSKRASTSVNSPIGFFTSPNRYFRISVFNSMNNIIIDFTNTYQFIIGKFYHVSITRNVNDFKVFIDGSNVFSFTYSSALLTNSSNVEIGGQSIGVARRFNGYIDDLRITKGVARYTTNFTPPTQAFPNS